MKKADLPLYCLILLAAALPFKAMLSVFIILAILATIIVQPIKTSIQNLKDRPYFILFSLVYFLYVIALIHTENMSFARRELEFKLSFLIMPLLLGAINRFTPKKLKWILKAFVFSNVFAGIVALLVGLFNNSFSYIPTYIEYSIFLHPTYYSVYLNLSFILLVLVLKSGFEKANKSWLFYSLAGIILLLNFLVNSKIGLAVNLLLISIFAIKFTTQFSRKKVLTILALGLIALVTIFSQVPSFKERYLYLKYIYKYNEISNDSSESSQIRVLVWQQVFQIIDDNFWVGVGTGDTKDELMTYYKKNKITYAYQNRLNTHNQYFECFITYGLLGFIIWIISILFPIIKSLRGGNKVYVFFVVSVLLIFLVESFLENEAGIVFFTFFNSLLFFHSPKLDDF